MARSEIADKVSELLQSTNSEWSEANAVYFLVQLRKLLDHAREATQKDLPHLRFYCDWVVHISKDRIDPITLTVIKALEQDVERQIKQPNLYLGKEAVNFAYFQSLKEEVIKVLKMEGIESSLIKDEESWIEFIATLVKVLENQPLNINESYGLNLSRLLFLPSAHRCVIMRIDFVTPMVGKDNQRFPFYTLKNAY